MKFFIPFFILLTFCSNHRFNSIEGQYQSSRHIDPYSFIYYNLKYSNVHFPSSDLFLNKDLTFSFKTCSYTQDGKYYFKSDTIFLVPFTKNNKLTPLVFIVKRGHLVSTSKHARFTNVWKLNKVIEAKY